MASPQGQRRRQRRRQGHLTKVEHRIIEGTIQASPEGLTPKQITSLATVLERRPESIKKAVQEARLKFAEKAGRYVEVHAQAVENALANGDAASLEVAQKGSQWAIEHMQFEGESVVEKQSNRDAGAKIYIGVSIGGKNPDVAEVK